MAKTKTATVGGTPTSPAASQYTQWMQNMLGGGGYTNAINTLLGGSAAGDPKDLTNYYRQMGATGAAQPFTDTNFNIPALSNQQMPSWMGTQFQQAPMFDTKGMMGNANPAWQNPSLSNNFQMSAGGIDPQSAYAQAIQQMVGNQQQQDVAALRERFTGNAGSRGTPAAIAESNLRAQQAPQLVNAMEQANQAERGLNLQQMGLANQAVAGQNQLLTQLGLGQNQFNQGNAQFGANLGLQGAGLNADIINSMNQLMGQQGLAQNNFNQGNTQLGMQQSGLNADMLNQLNQLMLGRSGQQNDYNLQNQQMQNQFGLGLGNMAQGFSQQNLQGMLGALGPLAGQFSQLLGLGTPQAQTVQQNTGWGNFLGSMGDITGMGANIAGMFMGMPSMGNLLTGAPTIQSTPSYAGAGQLGLGGGYVMPNINMQPLALPSFPVMR